MPATPTAAAVSPTSTATPIPVTGKAPAPQNPSGDIVDAEVVTPTISGDPAVQGDSRYIGVWESLFTTNKESDGTTNNSVPMLATGFKLAPDLSSVTITIRQGVQFQQNWGEMTANDVAWTINRINPAINPTSIATSAANFAALFGTNKLVATDKYTITAKFSHYDVRLTSYLLNQYGQTPAVVVPEAEFTQKGEAYLKANPVGTGPFQMKSYKQDVKVVVEKVPYNHWRKSPAINTFTVLEVPTEQTRISMLQTGEVDSAYVAPVDVSRVAKLGFKWIPNGNATEEGVFFTGNLWDPTNAITGKKIDFASSGVYVNPVPWVGDPFLGPPDVRPNTPQGMDNMEQARLVRTALAESVDRKSIVTDILGGFGNVEYVDYFDVNNSNWQSKWNYPYDPKAAGTLLDKAGYPAGSNGTRFQMPLFVGPELGGGQGPAGEIADAIAGYWNKIGIDVQVLKYAYAVFRPGLVSRTTIVPFLTSCDEGQTAWPWDWPHGQEMTTLSRGGFGCGFESPDILKIYEQEAAEPDPAKRIALNDQLATYLYHWALDPGYVAVPSGRFVNPNSISSWNMDPSLTDSYNSPENIVPASR